MEDDTVSARNAPTTAPTESDFRNLADALPQLAWIAEADGAIVWFNRRWYDYTGTSPAEMVGDGWRAVHHPDHLDQVAARFSACIAAGESWQDTFPLRGRDGQYRWFLSLAEPVRGPTARSSAGTGPTRTSPRRARRRTPCASRSSASAP
ncbi:PAS domain-containing protein [Methylorubrum suomiense]